MFFMSKIVLFLESLMSKLTSSIPANCSFRDMFVNQLQILPVPETNRIPNLK